MKETKVIVTWHRTFEERKKFEFSGIRKKEQIVIYANPFVQLSEERECPPEQNL